MKRLCAALVVLGVAMAASGAGMRVYAQLDLLRTQVKLQADRPTSPAEAVASTAHPLDFKPAHAAPTRISLPASGLWNVLVPVDQDAEWVGDQASLVWGVADAGWHIQSAWPGWGGNVVIAGHSPSRDPDTWAHSVFRQLAYLNKGDPVQVTAGDRVYLYAVSTVFAVPGSEAQTPDATAWIDRGATEHLTLITCWPPRTAAFRVVVIAQPVNSRPVNALSITEKPS